MSTSLDISPTLTTGTPAKITATTTSSSPWGIKTTSTVTAAVASSHSPAMHSFKELMSEQMADDMHEREVTAFTKKTTRSASDADLEEATRLSLLEEANRNRDADLEEATRLSLAEGATAADPVAESDFLLAQLLQLEMDKEADEELRRTEKQHNKNSRVTISYDNFKTLHPLTDKAEKELTRNNAPEVTSSDESEDELTKLKFKNGVHGKGENMISKHDPLLTGRHNANKVMKFPPSFDTGDGHGKDLRLSNKVFNMLKVHSLHADKRSSRLNDKQDKATHEISLDPKTRLILFKLVNAAIIESVGGVISTGKEAVILYCEGGRSHDVLVPAECVAKVYKTTLNEFKTREKYIADDYRFKDRYKRLNPQKIIKLWAEKELHNLMKMKSVGIRCPDTVMLKKHVLIMSFIGKDAVAAPKLKDANLTPEQLQIAYEQSVQLVTDLYNKCNLVHADFNQFNLLWHEDNIWVVDVSQSVESIHPMGFEFLLRDCINIFKYFTNRGLNAVQTGEELFNQVTGMSFKGEGDVFLAQIQKYQKDKRTRYDGGMNEAKRPYNFDYHFARSDEARAKGKKVGAGEEDGKDNDDSSSSEYESDDIEDEEEDEVSDEVEEDTKAAFAVASNNAV